MSTSFFSYANNFRDMDRIGVDPRTGQFLVNIPIESLIGNNLLGPEFLLKLSYNPLDRRNRDFGVGFSLGLTQFNSRTGFLELSNGETWQVEPGTTSIRHYPGNNVRFSYTNGGDDTNGYTVFWKDGRTERLENTRRDSENFVTTTIMSPLGHSLKLGWDSIGLLHQLRDDDKVFCTISYNSTPAIRMWRGMNEEYRISFEFDDNRTQLSRILYNLSPDKSSDSTEFWSFEYASVGDESHPRLTGVIHPAGMSERVEYSSTEDGLRFPEGSGMSHLPVVTHYTRDPGSGQPKTEINYSYTDKNFLGGSGREFGTWSADEDYIYKDLTEYTYGSMEKTGDSGKTVTIVRRYNNYHLLASEAIETKESDAELSAYRTEFTYPARLWHFIDNQPAQFQFPEEKKEIWNNAEGITHSQSTQTRFDEFGNLLREVTPVIEGDRRQGTTTVTTWYPAEGEGKDCPREPNGFVRFMKEQTITPMETDFDAPVMRMHYTHTTLGDSDHVVPAGCSFWSDGILMGKQEFTYHGERGTEHFGRLKKITDTKYDHGEHSASFISRMEFDAYISTGLLHQTAVRMGHDDFQSGTHYSQSVFSGRVFHRTDARGVVTAYEYDRLGRIVVRTDARDTDYRNELRWSYVFNRENATAGSVVTKTDMANNRVRSRFDGSGQILLEERSDADAPERWYTVFRKPEPTPPSAADAVSAMVSDGSGAAGDPEPDGEARIVSTSDKRIGRPVTICRVDSKGEEYSKREYRWDGLGRLREETDELGRITTYTYDAYNRLLTRTLPDSTVISWNYAPHLTGGQIASIHVNGFDGNSVRKTEYLGNQFFDSLGRLTQRTSGGRTTTYVYEDTSQIPSHIITPSRKSIKYKYEPTLGDAISRVNVNRISQRFDYDKKTDVVLQASEDLFGQTNQWDSRSRLKTETFFYNETEALAHYGWTPNGSLATYKDVTGAEFRLECNSDGQVIRLVHSDLTADFAYDDKGRLNIQMVKDVSGKATLATTLTYDDFDRETSRTLADSTGTTVFLTQSWTQNDKLASRVTEKNDTVICEENYEYDRRDRLVSYRVSGNDLPKDAYGYEIREQNYKYDALNNLVEVKTVLKDGSEDIATFSYENGKDPTQLTSVTHTHPSYPQRIDLAYDAEGRLIKDEEGRTLTYDGLGRLSSISNSTYKYDGFNRLVRQSILNGIAVHDLYYCSDKLVNEVITRGGSDARKRRFIKFGDNCLGVHDGTRLVLTGCDRNGSLIWSRRSDDASWSSLYRWPPYGNSGGDVSLPGFNGERIDPVSGAYHLGNGYRAYNPVLMRFTSPDDFSPFGDGGINHYAYCNGDPVNYTDPSGHMSWQAMIGIILGTASLGIMSAIAGMAVLAAGGVMAAFGAASATSLIVGGLGVASDVAAITSGALEDTDPELSSILGWVSSGLGITGLTAGLGIGISIIRRHRVNPNLYQARLSSVGQEIKLTKSNNDGLRNIDFVQDGFYIFTDSYKGGKRLNIAAHGNMVDGSSKMVIGLKDKQRYMEVDELARLLKNRYNLNAYDNLRTISCYSGSGGESSFAAKLSKMTGKPVKGYIETLAASHEPYELTKLFKEYWKRGRLPAFRRELANGPPFQIEKETNPFKFYQVDYYRWNYQPIKFIPS